MMRRLFLVISSALLSVFVVHAQTTPTATTRADLNLYAAATPYAAIIASVPADSAIAILGRDAFAHWLLVETDDPDGFIRGWVVSGGTVLENNLSLWDVAVSEEVISTGIAPLPTPVIPTSDGDVLAQYERLMAVPMLENTDTEAVEAIFAHGQELGLRADVFTRVGDSNTTSGGFLNPIGMNGNFCDFGAYSYLQDTVDFFSVSPQSGEPNSFDSFSVAAVNGLGTAAAMDPFWANAEMCQANESPLACEYRLVQPSVAIIMLGLMDVEHFEPSDSYEYMRDIMDFTLEQGVIPVWTTFPVLANNGDTGLSWERSLYFNTAILDIVEEYQTPLINLWAAVQPLPDTGIGPDRVHLAQAVGEFCSFTGAEQRLGGTLRNLLTLQALDLLRREVLEG